MTLRPSTQDLAALELETNGAMEPYIEALMAASGSRSHTS